MPDLAAALQDAQVWMDEIPGVESVAESESDGKPCIWVYVTSPEAAARLPKTFQGYIVRVQAGDVIQAQPTKLPQR
jgi:hypothetical protein